MQIDGHAWHGGRVLVCEGNYLFAEIVGSFLKECGLRPIGPTGRLDEAIRLGSAHPLDGAVLDINLNGRLCFSLCDILSRRQIPFLFLTRYSALDVVPPQFRQVPLVIKPFDPDELKAALARMLGLSDGQSPVLFPGLVLRH